MKTHLEIKHYFLQRDPMELRDGEARHFIKSGAGVEMITLARPHSPGPAPPLVHIRLRHPVVIQDRTPLVGRQPNNKMGIEINIIFSLKKISFSTTMPRYRYDQTCHPTLNAPMVYRLNH